MVVYFNVIHEEREGHVFQDKAVEPILSGEKTVRYCFANLLLLKGDG